MTSSGTDKCKHCQKDLPVDHKGPCPYCGKVGKIITVTAHAVGVGKASVRVTHKPKWSGESLALFFGFVAIFLAIVIPGILMLLPFCPGANYGILVGLLLIAGFIFWWKRYRVLMLIRRVESKFGGEETS